MNTNRMTSTKQINLSATGKSQKNTDTGHSHSDNCRHSRSPQNKDVSSNKAQECLGGVCSVNWKPIHNIA